LLLVPSLISSCSTPGRLPNGLIRRRPALTVCYEKLAEIGLLIVAFSAAPARRTIA